MTVLPSLDIFEKYVSNSRDRAFSDINSIFFNENIDILITSNYLDLLEMNLDNFDLIQALTLELFDNDRIANDLIDNEIQDTYENFYEKLYIDNVDKIDCLFAININENPNINHYKYYTRNKQTKSKEYLLFELLKSNILSFHHYDFNSNAEIQNLIKRVFSMPKNLSRILIYNRYAESNYFTFLKNKSIHYFNLIPSASKHQRTTEYIRIENDLKLNLGRNVILKSTDDLTKLHERKVLYNHFILTFDQSFDNTIITDHSWKIDVEIDRKICMQEWNKKHGYFVRLT
ncbi:hypothetical protein [Flavobacterium sp.]|jgi:hypothetical protein|uniref:hypothetical protein n=1 Tax=Flavobacterium sp. TaxID=239 RepID=UPI0037C0A575